ncbi:hypothetical protein A1F95_05387, partial [Pyrenophora tritici-repentis]
MNATLPAIQRTAAGLEMSAAATNAKRGLMPLAWQRLPSKSPDNLDRGGQDTLS